MFGFDALEGYGEAVLLAAGSRDPYCSVDDLERLAKRLARPAVEVIEGADHFFFGKLYPLGEAIRGWITRWLAGP
jgi:alpha/beta superfamily hydrolase